MRLFNVVPVYSNGHNLPEVREILVIKETPNNYLVISSLATGYRSRIPKGSAGIAFTEVEAWDKYIERAKKVRANMKVEWDIQCDYITHAQTQRRIAVDNDVKIGGTD